MIIGKYGLKNGKIVRLKNLKLPFFDLGFLRGYSVFQFMEAHNGAIFYEKDRIKNLFNYCKEALINIGGVDYIQKLPALLKKLIEKNKLKNSSVFIRVDITAGLTSDSFRPAKNSLPNCLVFCLKSSHKKEPLSLFTYKYERPAAEAKKSQDYFLAEILLKNSPYDDVLYIDGKGNVLETSRKNIFIAKNGVVKTPAKGILKGLTRSIVLNLLRKSGEFKVKEADIALDELYGADEVFITSTSFGVFPVGRIDKKKFKSPGEITERLQEIYSNHKREYYKKLGIEI